PLFARDPAKLDRARYQTYEQFLFDNKLIKKITPVEQYAVELD
ncbi:TPA: thiamine biosynthesis protein, partial [Serratia marcescens]|nr:thiamine biosynthesis protein [Serratia marcescens]